MKIFKDLFTGEEVCADTHPIKDVNDAVLCVKGKYETMQDGIDDSLIGGNKSAEGGDEGTDDQSRKVLNIVHNHKLTETGFKNKKDYGLYIKDYVKRLQEKLKDSPDLDKFKKGAEEFVRGVMKEFNEYMFYMGEKWGEGDDGPGMIILLRYYEENGEEVPYFFFFKHGLLEEKV